MTLHEMSQEVAQQLLNENGWTGDPAKDAQRIATIIEREMSFLLHQYDVKGRFAERPVHLPVTHSQDGTYKTEGDSQ
jgi:hypothetical protein